MLLLMAMVDDEEDREKLKRIYEKYVGYMYHKAYEILGNRQDAEDAVHNAFLKIIDHLHKLSEHNEVATKWYLVMAAKNAAIDLYRKKKRTQEEPLDELVTTAELTGIYDGKNPIAGKILELPPKDRDILILKYLYGYKYAEIGDIMKMTAEAVRKAVKRAEMRLEKECEKEGLL